MHDLYEHILAGLVSARLFNSNQIAEELQNLQPHLEKLRRSYKTDYVRVNYSESSIQAAYLLAYYPHYVKMTYKVIEELAQNEINLPFQKAELKACFFGSGPVPEAIGWLLYLKNNSFQTKSATAYAFDIAANTWAKSQKVTKFLAPRVWSDVPFTLEASEINLCKKDAFHQIANNIQASQLFVVQNCLNEIAIAPGFFFG